MRSSLIAVSAALTFGLATASSAAYAGVVGNWHLDERSGSVMKDSSAAGNDGAIRSVRLGVPGLVSGSAYRFGGNTSYVEVPDDNTLDPGAAAITITATVQADNVPMPDDSYDLVRKGVTTTAGGEYKMEIKRASDPRVGRLNCVFKGVVGGSRVAVARTAGIDLIDGRAHTVQCVRSAGSVKAVVDGKTYTTVRESGTISNAEPVVVGAKSTKDDVLLGVLDEVRITVG
jgi:hypothetical protein